MTNKQLLKTFLIIVCVCSLHLNIKVQAGPETDFYSMSKALQHKLGQTEYFTVKVFENCLNNMEKINEEKFSLSLEKIPQNARDEAVKNLSKIMSIASEKIQSSSDDHKWITRGIHNEINSLRETLSPYRKTFDEIENVINVFKELDITAKCFGRQADECIEKTENLFYSNHRKFKKDFLKGNKDLTDRRLANLKSLLRQESLTYQEFKTLGEKDRHLLWIAERHPGGVWSQKIGERLKKKSRERFLGIGRKGMCCDNGCREAFEEIYPKEGRFLYSDKTPGFVENRQPASSILTTLVHVMNIKPLGDKVASSISNGFTLKNLN